MAGSHQASVTEYKVKIPASKSHRKTYQIMKFNSSLNIDPAKWTTVRMTREKRKEAQGMEEEMPKYGAGSEFGREQREEARRKRFGMNSKKFHPERQPWHMRIGNKKDGKYYKGNREGGISDNTSYYIFTQAQDGSFEAHKVSDWYNFTPRVTYKTLDVDEAEEKFAERGKILNHWAVMVNKKLKPEGGGEAHDDLDGDGSKGKKGKGGGSSFKISDMDDWIDSADEFDSEDDDKKDESDDGKKKKGSSRSKDSKKKGSKKKGVDGEDSDDGDDEGREVDYMSDESSESDEELMEQADEKGVDQDEGLAKMLDSDDSEEEEDKDKKDEEDNEDEEGKKKKKKGDTDEDGKTSKQNSRSGTPALETQDEKAAKAEKRKALVDSVLDPNSTDSPAKKSRLDTFGSSSASGSTSLSNVEPSFEDDVRRYLARKPMTTIEILKKLKSKKKYDFQNEELMPLLVNCLKKINPVKQKVKGTMYLSLKK